MSKKMMKRSLALGALMAFVITGSAMAAEFVGEQYDLCSTIDNQDSVVVNVSGGATPYTHYGVYLKSDVADVGTLDITSDVGGVIACGDYDINAEKISIKNGTYASIYTGEGYTVNLKADEIYLEGPQVIVSNDVVNIEANNKMTLKGNIASWSEVNVVFNGSDSSFTGKVTLNDDAAKTKLALNDGSTWNVTGNSTITELAGNNAQIRNDTDEKVTLTLNGLKDNPDTDKNEATGTALNGNVKVTVTDVDLAINSEGTAIYNQDVTIISNSDVTINAKQQGISAYGDVDIEAKNVTIESFDNGIQSVADKNPNDVGNVSIKAVADENGEGGIVLIKATTEGYAVTNVSQNGGQISIEGKDITLVSENRTAVKVGHELGIEGYNGTLNVTGETITVEGAAQNPENGNERKGSAVYAQGGTLNLNATTKLTITDTSKVGNKIFGSNAIGAYGGTVSVDGGAETVINGKIMAQATGDEETIINVKGETINVNAVDYTGICVANADSSSINPSGKSVVNLGDENTKKININDAYIGIYVGYNGSEVNINGAETGSELNIEDKDGDSYAGIWILNGNTGDEDTNDNAKLVIDKNTKTTIDMYKEDAEGNRTVSGYAICNSSEGIVQIEGDLTVYAENAIYTRGEAVTEINKNGGSVVAINGDIMYGEGNAGDVLDAKVLINLDNEDSYLNGNIYTANTSDVRDDSLTEKVDNMTLALSNDAQWTTDAASFVNELTLNDGIVNVVEGSEGAVTVDKVTGAGGTINVDNATANQVVIGEKVATEEVAPVLTVATTNQELSLEDLADVAVMSASTDSEVVAAADYVAKTDGTVYELEKAAVNSNGTLGEINKVVDAGNLSANDMAAVGLMSWRAEMNDMNKRMGELRNANGDLGVWVRMVRGESEYNSVKNQYNQYQLGYDEKLSVDKRWTVGAAISYTDAENSFAQGSGESTNKALSIYGSKLNADGTFVDLIAKYARLENEFDIVSGMGDADYSTNGYSFSAEFGKRIQQGKGLWIEPQVELTYGKVSAVDYVTANGVNVAQDGMESLVGRVGFSLGKDVKGGNVYARASYLYDFEGETQATLDNDAVLEQDLGGGWWEVGVGANINLSKATYIYADIEKTFGGEVDTNWQWNLGVRYSF